jgi:hypothetical protein
MKLWQEKGLWCCERPSFFTDEHWYTPEFMRLREEAKTFARSLDSHLYDDIAILKDDDGRFYSFHWEVFAKENDAIMYFMRWNGA